MCTKCSKYLILRTDNHTHLLNQNKTKKKEETTTKNMSDYKS